MAIRVKYYYHEGGKFFKVGGELLIKKRRIVPLGPNAVPNEESAFFYDDTDMQILYAESKNRINKIRINRILTESVYRFGQKQFLVHLNWLQQQRLNWMFHRHWLQQPRHTLQLIIFFIIIALAGIGITIIEHIS
ncbi:MAG: hypothetical protein JNL88_01040 [Bacteroidia bacterium]|nr:hypothetical protein [Bacteroidia bacterium]